MIGYQDVTCDGYTARVFDLGPSGFEAAIMQGEKKLMGEKGNSSPNALRHLDRAIQEIVGKLDGYLSIFH